MERQARNTTTRPAAKGTRKRRESKRMMDTRLSLQMSLVFFAFLLLLALFLLVVPRSTVSEVEKRSLATFPSFSFESYFSGEFTSGITHYYDDTVPARDSLKNAGNNIKQMFGINTAGSVEVVGNVTRLADRNTDKTADEPEEAVPEAETLPGEEAAETAAAEAAEPETKETINSKDYHVANADATMEDGIVVVYQDGHWRGLPLYVGILDTVYSDTLNYISAMLGDSVNLYFMPVPLASQFYLPSNYRDYSADQKQAYQEVVERLDTKNIVCIDIIDTLNNHNEEPIYLRTDHHWASLGAYYAAREFTKAAGVPFPDLDTYEVHVNEGYVGTMYAYTESANILNDPEDFVYYVPSNDYITDYYDSAFNYNYSYDLFIDMSAIVSNSYSTFMGGDDLIAKVTTDVGNGRKLLVVKDSYGNAEIQFLLNSFEEIYVIDQRYFDLNLLEFIYTTGVTDVLFTHNYFSLSAAEAELLEWITYYNSGMPIYDEAPEHDFSASSAPAGPEADEETEEQAGYGEDAGTYEETI